MIRVLTATLGLACLAGAGAAVYFAAAEYVQPGLYAAEQTIEFGDLSQGDSVTGEFRLTNRYAAPITVLDVLTGCSCTEVEPSLKTVPPGGLFTVKAKWAIGGRHGQLLDTVSVHYRTSDGSKHLAELGLAATVTPDIVVSSDRLEFDGMGPGHQTVKFTPGKVGTFSLKSARTDHPALRATIDDQNREVVVKFDPKAGWVGIGGECAVVITVAGRTESEVRVRIGAAAAEMPRE